MSAKLALRRPKTDFCWISGPLGTDFGVEVGPMWGKKMEYEAVDNRVLKLFTNILVFSLLISKSTFACFLASRLDPCYQTSDMDDNRTLGILETCCSNWRADLGSYHPHL